MKRADFELRLSRFEASSAALKAAKEAAKKGYYAVFDREFCFILDALISATLQMEHGPHDEGKVCHCCELLAAKELMKAAQRRAIYTPPESLLRLQQALSFVCSALVGHDHDAQVVIDQLEKQFGAKCTNGQTLACLGVRSRCDEADPDILLLRWMRLATLEIMRSNWS